MSYIKYDRDVIRLLCEEYDRATDIAKAYAERTGIEYTESIRKNINKIVLAVRDTVDTETNDYSSPGALTAIPSALKADGTFMTIDEFCDEYGLDKADVKSSKLITHSGIKTYNIAFHSRYAAVEKTQTEIFEAILDQLKSSSVVASEQLLTKQKTTDGNYCLVIDPADVHIGKLSRLYQTRDEYNSSTAKQRVIDGVNGIVKASSGYNINQVVLVIGNDIVHVDNQKNTTTSGTPQDVSNMWFDSLLIAQDVYVTIIDQLRQISNVHVVFNPSNHDYMSGWFIAQVLKTFYRNIENVTFDCDLTHRKYFVYGVNLIGSSHGDGAKINDMANIVAAEVPEKWGATKKRYMYLHHFHSKSGKDFPGLTVECVRSPSGTDNWHSIQGYIGAPKAIEGFIHHHDYGQVAHLTHHF